MTRKGTSGAAGIVAYWMQTAGGKCSHGRHQNVWESFRNGDDKEIYSSTTQGDRG